MSRPGSPLAVLAAAALAFGCSSDSDSEDREVTFTRDIHPILTAKCGGSDCHGGEQAPFLPGHGAEDVQEAYAATQETSYTGEFVYERILARITDEDAMMPPDFANPPCLGEIGATGCVSQAELDRIEAWIEAGTPL